MVLIISGFGQAEPVTGIALQEIAPRRFKKVGTVLIDYMVQGKEWSQSNPDDEKDAQRFNERLQSLPVGDVEII